jgi:hypothetical protein
MDTKVVTIKRGARMIETRALVIDGATWVHRSEVGRRQRWRLDVVSGLVIETTARECSDAVAPAPMLERRWRAVHETVHQAVAAIFEANPDEIRQLQQKGLLPDLRARLVDAGAGDQAIDLLQSAGLVDDPIVLLRFLDRHACWERTQWAMDVLTELELAAEPLF